MVEKKKADGRPTGKGRNEARVAPGGSPEYGTGVVKITPDLAFKLKMIADFRGSSIADITDAVLRAFVEAQYGVMLDDAAKLRKGGK
jgi:hypothetical protein